MTRWTDPTTEHVKAAIAARTCPLCGNRIKRVVWRVPGVGRVEGRQCVGCGAEIHDEEEAEQLRIIN